VAQRNALRQSLSAEKVSGLQRRCAALVAEEVVARSAFEAALDGGAPKLDLVELVVGGTDALAVIRAGGMSVAEQAALRAELEAERVPTLQVREREGGREGGRGRERERERWLTRGGRAMACSGCEPRGFVRGIGALAQPIIHVRVRGEIMGSHKCGIVGESQPVLMMIDPMIPTRSALPTQGAHQG
jgi:hypothetical protein